MPPRAAESRDATDSLRPGPRPPAPAASPLDPALLLVAALLWRRSRAASYAVCAPGMRASSRVPARGYELGRLTDGRGGGAVFSVLAFVCLWKGWRGGGMGPLVGRLRMLPAPPIPKDRRIGSSFMFWCLFYLSLRGEVYVLRDTRCTTLKIVDSSAYGVCIGEVEEYMYASERRFFLFVVVVLIVTRQIHNPRIRRCICTTPF